MAAILIQSSGASFINTGTIAFPANVTNGNLLIVMVVKSGTDGTGIVFAAGDLTKSAGTATIGTVTIDVTRLETTSVSADSCVGIFSVPVTGSGSLTLQIAVAGGEAILIGIMEWAEMDTGGSRVATTASAEGSGTTPAAGSVASGQAGVFAAVTSNLFGATIVNTANAEFTLVYEKEAYDPSAQGSAVFKLVNSDQTWNPRWTLDNSVVWCAAVAVYKESAAAGATPIGGGGIAGLGKGVM